MLQPRRRGAPPQATPKLARYRLRPGASDVPPETIATGLELPQVHPSRWARAKASVAWAAAAEEGGEWIRFVVRDTQVLDRKDSFVLFEGEPQLTLITCYPFDAVVPGGPLRFVVWAEMEEG